MPQSGRAHVKVIGSGDRCYVVVAVPGSGTHTRGPMFEDEAIEAAKEEAEELRLAFSIPAKDDRSKTVDVLWYLFILGLGAWAVFSYYSP